MRSDSTLARWLHQVRQTLGSSATLARGKARRERAVRQLRAHNQTAEPWLAEERLLLSAPAVVLSVTDATYTENAPPVTLDPAITANDPDADFITGAQVKITDYVMGQDQLSFTANHGISGSFDNTTGILTLSGAATATQYASVLSSVQYQNLSENPTDLQRTIEYTITDTEPATSAPATLTLNLVPVADTPADVNATVDEDTLSGPIVLMPNPVDGTSVTHFQITGITGGTLYQADGLTPINDGDFITLADANAGLKFQGNSNYFGPAEFKFQAATGNTPAELGGAKATANITIDPVADTPADVVAMVDEDTLSAPILLSPNPVDGMSVTHYQITGITNGTLYKADGITQINDGDFITAADAAAGVRFQGNTNYFGAASFNFQAATGGTVGDLGGGLATANITVNSVNDDPTITGPGAQTVDEGTVLTFSNATLNPITINDVDAASNLLTVEIQATGPAATYTLGSTSGITFVQGTNGGTTPLIIQGTLTDLQAALNGLQVQPQDNGTLNLTFIVTDEALASDQVLVPITVNNVPPTLTLNPVVAVNENGVATLSGTITDPGTADTFTLVVDWGDGSAPVTYTYAAGTTTFSETHQYLDDNPSGTASDSYTISATLTDDDTGSDTKTTSVTVNNVAPVLTLNPVVAVNENGVATLSGTITDPGTADTFTLVVDWGDGSAPVTYTYTAGTTTFSETHQYLDDNPTGTASDSYTISATLTDDDTGSDTKTTSVTVNNVAPVLTLNPVIAVDENGVATLSGSYTDTGTQDTHTLAINWGDGSPVETVVVTGGTFSVTHQYLDDNPTGTPSDSYTISATLTDDDTGSDTKTTSVTVNNVAPVLTLNPVVAVNENGVATLSGTITDTGTQDTHTLAINWGDGSPVQTVVVTGGTFSVTHQYLDDNPTNTSSDSYTISATLTDDDTGNDTKTTTVTVNNVAPVLTLNPVTTVNENGVATLSGTITDPGTADTFTLVVDWGDGTAPVTYVYAAGTTTFSETHQYLDDNPTGTASDNYTISATLTDDDTGSDTKTTSVTVNNVAPVLTLNPVVAVNENGVATLSGTITDPGTADTFTLVVDWGDGSAPVTYTYAAGTTTFSETHQYLDDNPTGTPSDSYTISATLTDDDTGVTSKSTTVTVNNVAPMLTLNPVVTINENGVATLSGTITDPGTADTFTLVVDWGDGTAPDTYTYAAGTTTFSETHQYLDDNPSGTASDSYTISATLTDDDTGVTSKSTTVTVNNVNPTLTLAGPPPNTINEGDFITVTGSATDPANQPLLMPTTINDPLTYAWSVTKDGNPYASGVGHVANFQAVDNGVYVVTMTVTDDDLGSDTQTYTINVANVAPTPTVTGDTTGFEGTPINLTASSTDPANTPTTPTDNDSVSYTWSVTRNGTFYSSGAGTSYTLTPNNEGTYVVTLTAADEDGGVQSTTHTVVVANVAPTATINATDIDGQFYTYVDISVADPGDDNILVQIVWGDINPDDFLFDPFVNGESAMDDRVFPTVSHRYLNAPNPQDPLADVQVNFIIKDGTDTVIVTIFLKVTEQGIPAGGVYVTPEAEEIVLPEVQAVAEPPAILTQPAQQQVRNEEVVSREDTLTDEDARLVLHVVGPTGVEGPAVTLPDGLLKNLRSLFNKLPDGHYRVYLVQGESRRLVIEVFVRQGRAIDPAEADQGTQERPPQAQPAAGNEPDRVMQAEPLGHAPDALQVGQAVPDENSVPMTNPSLDADVSPDANLVAEQVSVPTQVPSDLQNEPKTAENAEDSGLASLAAAGIVASESWRRAARRQRAAAVTTGPDHGEKIEKTWSRLARRARQWKPR